MSTMPKHTLADEAKRWSRQWARAEWEAAVCQGQFVMPATLATCFALEWEPADCREYLAINKLFKRLPRERLVLLDDEAINKRFAMCLWRECTKLLTRRMTPSARRLVSDMYVRMGKQLGIE